MLKRTELIKRMIALLVMSCVFLCTDQTSGIYTFAADNGIQNDSSRAVPTIDPTDMQGGWMPVLYDNENGLPTTEANTIAETSEGFIWIGSYGGLIRYDGNTFERMDSTWGITSVLCLLVDKKDRLWIGTNANGIAVMENGEYRIWDKDDGLRSVSIHSVCEDSKGNIYFGSTEGLGRINTDMELEMLNDPRLSEAYVSKLCLGNDGLIYGVTLEGDLFTLGKH